MSLKLYAYPISISTRRVQVVLAEVKVPYELVILDMGSAEHKTSEYLEKQPFGKTPYLDDNGFIIYESRAICHYIATTYGTQGANELVPTDSRANALYQQAVSIERSYFDPYAEALVVENVVKPVRGQIPSEQVVQNAIQSLETSLDGYERILSKQKFLAGDTITLADLYHLPCGSLFPAAGALVLQDDVKRPNVARWWKDIMSRPSCQEFAYSPDGLLSV